jgi:ABC transporter transmembrane region
LPAARLTRPLPDGSFLFNSESAGFSVSKTGVDSVDGAVQLVEDDASGAGDATAALDVDPNVISRAFKLNSAEWLYMLTGCVGAALAGASWPINALIFSEATVLLRQDDNENKITFWSLMYVLVAVVAFVGNTLQMGMLGISGGRLTRKLRSASFRTILCQEIGFF